MAEASLPIAKQFADSSSWLQWAAHDPTTKKLLIGTGHGTYISGKPVSDNMVREFYNAVSPGGFFNAYLRPAYAFNLLGAPEVPKPLPWAPSPPPVAPPPARGSFENPFDSGPIAKDVVLLPPGQYYLHPRAIQGKPGDDPTRLPDRARVGLRELLEKVGSLHFITSKGMAVTRKVLHAKGGGWYVRQLVRAPGGDVQVPGGRWHNIPEFTVEARDMLYVGPVTGLLKAMVPKTHTRNHYRRVRRAEKKALAVAKLQAIADKALNDAAALRRELELAKAPRVMPPRPPMRWPF